MSRADQILVVWSMEVLNLGQIWARCWRFGLLVYEGQNEYVHVDILAMVEAYI